MVVSERESFSSDNPSLSIDAASFGNIARRACEFLIPS